MKKTTIYCPGRVSLDVMQNVKDDGNLKLNSYGLDAVCEAYELGSKGDVAPEEMWGRLNGTENDRGELLFYNILDVVLTARVLEVRLIVKSTAINSKVFRTFPSEMVTRGISYTLSRFIISRTYGKWMSPALHFDNELQRKRLHPKIVDVEEELKLRQTGIGGGLVLEPVPAYYDVPVAVLDYASLYPSIIRAHNICPTTWIRSKQELQEFGLTLDDVFVTPNQAMFVKPHIRRGILPVMLEELMDQRAATRKEQKKWLKVDVTRWEVLESIQLAFKLAANSTYGVLATHYLDFCLMVAGLAVTTYGQQYNTRVVKYLRTAEELLPYNVRVIYGDTDSTMLLFKSESVEDARRLFIVIQESVNKRSGIMTDPLQVGRDSLNLRALFVRKKGYAIVSVSAVPGDPIEPKLKVKGLQFVKRDTCEYVREVGMEFLERLMVQQHSKADCYAFLVRSFSALMMGEVPKEKLRLSAKLNRPLEEYAQKTGAHVIAAMQLIEKGKLVEPGDRMFYYFCELPPESTIRANKVKKGDLVVAAQIYDGKRPIHYMSYGERLVNSFRVIAQVVFGPGNADRLLDLKQYTKQAQLFRRGFSTDDPLPVYKEETVQAQVQEKDEFHLDDDNSDDTDDDEEKEDIRNNKNKNKRLQPIQLEQFFTRVPKSGDANKRVTSSSSNNNNDGDDDSKKKKMKPNEPPSNPLTGFFTVQKKS